jgi:Uma2 family endonuclease
MTLAPPLNRPLAMPLPDWLEDEDDDELPDADGIVYITSDGEPMAETPKHRDLMIYAIDGIKLHLLAQRNDVWVSGNDFIHYQQGDGNKYISPDCYVVFGVEQKERENFKVWEEGGCYPSVIIEFTSRKTKKQDFEEKKTLYEQVFQTAEYFIFDPTGKRKKKQRLWGFRLESGQYIEMELQDGRMWSAQLGLYLVPQDRDLRLYDPVKGEFLRTYDQAEGERLAALQLIEEERRRAEKAEAELARLRAELEARDRTREP